MFGVRKTLAAQLKDRRRAKYLMRMSGFNEAMA